MISNLIAAAIRDVPNFPKEGILFKDITPIFHDPKLVRKIVKALAEEYADQKGHFGLVFSLVLQL